MSEAHTEIRYSHGADPVNDHWPNAGSNPFPRNDGYVIGDIKDDNDWSIDITYTLYEDNGAGGNVWVVGPDSDQPFEEKNATELDTSGIPLDRRIRIEPMP